MISSFSTSTAALIGVISTSLVSSVKAQSSTGCVSLQGSTQCPSFQSQYINPQNLSTAWPWMSQVSDVISFDQQFALYWTDPNRFEQTKFHNQLQCNRTGSANVTIQWQRTVYCSMFTQISYSASCNSNVEPKMVCQDTCNQFSQSEYQIVQNSEICAPSSALTSQHNSTRYQTLVKDYTQCTNWTSLTSNNTQTCVEGSANEGNCGYGPYVGPQVCQACDPSSNNNNVPSCCTSANTDLRNCASYGYPGAARLAASSSSSSSAGSSSQTGSNSAYNSKGGPDLSKGQLAGIIVGSIIGAMLLGALIAALLFARRKRKSDPESRRGAGGIYSAAGAASSGRTSTGEKPWHSEDHMSRRSLAGSPEMEKTGAGSSNNMINMSSLGAGAAGVGAAGLGAAALSSNNHRNYDNQRSGSPVGRPASQALTSSSGGDKSATVPMVRDQYTGQDIHVGEEVVAIYPYNASLNDELTLEPEQRVTVVRLYDDGWALGRTADGNEGALPLVCVSSTKGDLPGRRGAGGNGSGTATGTSDDEGMTSGAEYTSSVDGAVTAEEGGFTSDARSQRSRR